MSKSSRPPKPYKDSDGRVLRILTFGPAIAAAIWMLYAWFTTPGKAPIQIITDWFASTHWWELVLKIIFTFLASVGWFFIGFYIFLARVMRSG
jgi:hypothetical protein